jgi:hypothetical protein
MTDLLLTIATIAPLLLVVLALLVVVVSRVNEEHPDRYHAHVDAWMEHFQC